MRNSGLQVGIGMAVHAFPFDSGAAGRALLGVNWHGQRRMRGAIVAAVSLLVIGIGGFVKRNEGALVRGTEGV
jgi:hypothetical protein